MTPELKGFLLFSVLKMLVVFTAIMVTVALLTLMERKVSAWMQDRHGPNRVGPGGLLQPVADGIKNFIKEETLPGFAHRWLFLLAPALAFIPAATVIAVIPWGAPLPLDVDFTLGPLGRFTYRGALPLAIADLPIGFLFVVAITSLGVYGISVAGWSSNSKFSLLGGLRASAQLISYEVCMGLSLVPVLMLSGNVALGEIIGAQQAGLWYVGPLFLSFFVFLVSGFAETNRLPFDLPEAESELVAGYHSEYSAMKFSLFFIAEYANIVTVSAMVTTLFFGGWDIPFTRWDEQGGALQTLATHVAFLLKVLFWVFFVMWIRWTLPRFRYDQLMALGWRFLIELATVYLVVMAVAIHVVERVLGLAEPRVAALVYTGLNVALGYAVFFVIDRGLIIRGSRQQAERAGRAPARPPRVPVEV